MNEIKKRRKKPKEQKSVLHNIEMLYKARNSIAKFFDGFLQLHLRLNIHHLI